MGHFHLATLPGTRKWNAVVDLLASGAPEQEVVAASAVAAEKDFAAAASNAIFVEAVRLLSMLPEAARSPDFGRALRDLGLDAPDRPLITDLLFAAGMGLERTAQRSGNRDDFSEITRRALLGTLSSQIGASLPRLFEVEAEDVRSATARLGRGSEFPAFARAFFGRLVADTLASWLDRTLSAQVGEGKRFAHAGDRAAFDAALDQYCHEATRIIREFAGGWRGKTLYRDGTVSTERATQFGAVCLKKITEELRRKRTVDV